MRTKIKAKQNFESQMALFFQWIYLIMGNAFLQKQATTLGAVDTLIQRKLGLLGFSKLEIPESIERHHCHDREARK
jgi:hypothetical protein